MSTSISIETDLDKTLEKVKELIESLNLLEDKTKKLQFISINDICEATGWSPNTVQDLFNRPDFPCCDYGKEKKAEIHAVIDYFKVPMRKYQ